MSTQDEIVKVCDYVKALLLEKNAAYGDSALKPIGIFSSGSALGLIRARIDDKLNRIKNDDVPGESIMDTRLDLIGYLVLELIAMGWKPNEH